MGSTYVTIEESAQALRVSERTVRRWIAHGVLPARKLAGTVRIPREAVTEASLTARRPRRGRPPKRVPEPLSAVSDEALARTWDNPEDAVYDRWRDIYAVRQG